MTPQHTDQVWFSAYKWLGHLYLDLFDANFTILRPHPLVMDHYLICAPEAFNCSETTTSLQCVRVSWGPNLLRTYKPCINMYILKPFCVASFSKHEFSFLIILTVASALIRVVCVVKCTISSKISFPPIMIEISWGPLGDKPAIQAHLGVANPEKHTFGQNCPKYDATVKHSFVTIRHAWKIDMLFVIVSEYHS